jgi:hypothetical protein
MVGKREVHGDRRRCLAGRLVLAQNAPELRFKGPVSADCVEKVGGRSITTRFRYYYCAN